MSEQHYFRAVIESARGGGAYVTVPFDVEVVFGKKRVPVTATIEGIPYRGSLVRMGGPHHILGILKEIREQTGKNVGDEVEIVLAEDTETREVAVPQDLSRALEADPQAKARFEELSYSHKKEYVRWVDEAKQDQTRQRRVAQTVERVKQGDQRGPG